MGQVVYPTPIQSCGEFPEEQVQQADRTQPRLRAILGARIIFANGNSSMDCLIRDISPSGARLELGGSVTVPDRFDLFVPQKQKTFRATIKWRRLNEVGVVFETEDQGLTAPERERDLPARVSELEAEILVLKQALAEMRNAIAEAIRLEGRR
jgi:hypothetical protein